MNEHIIPADEVDLEERLLSGAAVVFFYQHLDMESRRMEGIMEELAEQYEGVQIYGVDAEQMPELLYHHAIQMLPAVVIFQNGEAIELIEGANPPEVYTEILNEL